MPARQACCKFKFKCPPKGCICQKLRGKMLSICLGTLGFVSTFCAGMYIAQNCEDAPKINDMQDIKRWLRGEPKVPPKKKK